MCRESFGNLWQSQEDLYDLSHRGIPVPVFVHDQTLGLGKKSAHSCELLCSAAVGCYAALKRQHGGISSTLCWDSSPSFSFLNSESLAFWAGAVSKRQWLRRQCKSLPTDPSHRARGISLILEILSRENSQLCAKVCQVFLCSVSPGNVT